MTRISGLWMTTRRTHRMTTRNYKPRDEPDNVKTTIVNALINNWYREQHELQSQDIEFLSTLVIEQRDENAQLRRRINHQMQVIDIGNSERIRLEHENTQYNNILHDIMEANPDIYWGNRHRIHFDDLQQRDPEETELETDFSDNDDGVIADEDRFWGDQL